MDSAVSEDQKRRKLPLWMLGVAAADNLSKSRNGDITDVVTDEQVSVATQHNKPKRLGNTARCEKEVRDPGEDALEVEESSALVKCGTKRRKRGVSRQAPSCDEGVKEIGDAKKKRVRVGERVPSRRRKVKNSVFECNDDIEVSCPGEDDDDLTMEDIMSFAKEFVKGDNDKGQEQSSNGAPRAASQSVDAAFPTSENEVCIPSEEALEVEESSFIAKSGTRRRKRIVSRQDESRDASAKYIGSAKEKCGGVGRKVEEPVRSKRRKAKSPGSDFNNDDDDDDDDLTMEDLMSIAKEFVKDDIDSGRPQPADGVLRAENRSADAAFSRNESGGSTIAPQSIRRPPTHKEATSCRSSTENVTSKEITNKPSMTGDPTQDMLNLFLGPLLKKPAWEEKKVSLISEDRTFAHEVKKQSQNLGIVNVPVPLSKKKSSLKDKVAMYLD